MREALHKFDHATIHLMLDISVNWEALRMKTTAGSSHFETDASQSRNPRGLGVRELQ
jgi:hypothetical protein